MVKSYEKINYSIRPAKCIERKLICEAIHRVTKFGNIENYRYIGFGSAYFSDFYLFHRQLGINKMISIERDEENKDRFIYNKPFKCIDLRFGNSNDILPTIPWDELTVIWLDYDGKLEKDVITDINFIVSKAVSGSMIIFSVNAMPDKAGENRLSLLEDRVGKDNIPLNVEEKDLDGWGTAKIYQKIINNLIQQSINNRNGILPDHKKMDFKQLFSFFYADNAKMFTFGGLLFEKQQEQIVDSCSFDNLPFVVNDKNSYTIEVPNLTNREIHYLDSKLPTEDLTAIDLKGIPIRDIENYRRIYRYFPTFSEIDL